MSRVVLALSGGVDSSVAAYLLKQAGHEVIGVFIQHFQSLRPGGGEKGEKGSGSFCRNGPKGASHKRSLTPFPPMAAEAKLAAEGLGIPLHVLDLHSEFQPVIDYFVDEYAAGRTPNPCIFCNALIKFGKLYEYALSIGADYLATGHYARILNQDTPQARLCRGRDPDKDQSYFLYGIERRILPKLIFPVGEYTKPEIRRMAAGLGLYAAEKPDSQDICFIAKEEHARFVRQILSQRGKGVRNHLPERPEGCFAQMVPDTFSPGEVDLSGPIVTADGAEVGRHQGIENFTVGQRKGIGIALGEPHYVIRIEAEGRRVVVGARDQLARTELTARGANWLVDPPSESFRADVKIRYSSKPLPATIKIIDAARFRVIFDEPCFGVAPGQGAACYDGDIVLGGGWID